MKQISSSEFKSFIYGMMLGDSSIHTNGKEFSSRQVTKDLSYYKFEMIKKHLPGVKIEIKEYPGYFDGKWTHKPIFQIRAKHRYFEKMYERFYRNGKKVVIQKVVDSLKPNGFAVLFADDGCSNLIGKEKYLSGKSDRIHARRFEICTDAFTYQEVCLIMGSISKFIEIPVEGNMYTAIRKNGNHRIVLNSIAGQKYILKIWKFFFLRYPSLLYKLDLGYRDGSLENNPYLLNEYSEVYHKIKMHGEFIDRLKR